MSKRIQYSHINKPTLPLIIITIVILFIFIYVIRAYSSGEQVKETKKKKSYMFVAGDTGDTTKCSVLLYLSK